MSKSPPDTSRQVPEDIELMLVDLANATSPPASLARKHSMPLQSLAQWSTTSCALPALHALRTLADAQASLVISRSRAQAAKRLLRIAADRENPETARKACIDLLNVKTVAEVLPRAAAQGMSPVEHRSVLESLEQLGKASDPRRSK
jgi:hypothetical protein